jgi:hypothetical protein
MGARGVAQAYPDLLHNVREADGALVANEPTRPHVLRTVCCRPELSNVPKIYNTHTHKNEKAKS